MSNGITDLSGPQSYVYRIGAAMASAVTDDEQSAFSPRITIIGGPVGITLISATWTPDAAVTANGTNYTVLSIRNRTTGAGTALPFTRSYAATNSVAFVAESMTISGTAADALVANGDTLTVQRIHVGTGVIIPAGLIVITYTLR